MNNRLNAIVSLIKPCNVVADIGTDHGYVAEMLLNDNKCDKIIASDINKGPLNSAINNLTSKGLDDKVIFRLGSGMTVLNEGDANVAVIAGMGGDLISNIIETSKNVANSLDYMILQPMTNIEVLREYLYKNGFCIEEEVMVKEYHFYYFIMKVVPVKQEDTSKEIEVDEIYYSLSKNLFEKKDKLFLEYIKKVYNSNKQIISNLSKSNNESVKDKFMQIESLNNAIERMIKQYED